MLKIAWSPVYSHPLPEGHRFPMLKYELIPEQLLYEGSITPDNLFEPGPADDAVLGLTHSREYLDKLEFQRLSEKEVRRIGFPMSPSFVHRSRCISHGTLLCAHHAFRHGVSMNAAGGTHHAYADKGEGFCILNDMAVAANALLHEGLAERILFVDLDVHQGNGSAHIFRNEPRVFTFSMHGEKNYPHRKEHSRLDIGLDDHTDGGTYLRILGETLPRLLEDFQPQIVFYQAGVDVLKTDLLGRLALTREDCRQRDRFVLQTCKDLAIPLVITMGGGYSRDIRDIVEAHCNSFRLAQEIWF